ncbi:MAG: Mur ligase family protein [Rhodoglobus sp.]
MPGLVVNRIAPGFLSQTLNGFRDGLVIVTGSSGKSTTTKMLVAALEAHGRRVFTNPSTANISQGLTSALLERASLGGKIDADIAVLEMDEGHAALIASTLTPAMVVLTNVMTDQIDRFENSEKVLAMLAKIASRATERVISNADDAMLEEFVGAVSDAAVDRFGVSASVLAANPRGLGYARTASARIQHGTIVTSVKGATAIIAVDGTPLTVTLPSRGVHYAVDAASALSTAAAILGESFDGATAAAAISAMPPVFGRGEVVEVRGQRVEFVLVQNPASFQLNVDELPSGLDQILVAIGSDVRDPSYFWPVDISGLRRVAIVSGSKADEIALQLEYQDVVIDRIEHELGRALDDFLALPAPAVGDKTVVFSADSMRRTRSHLGLAK